MTTGVTKGGFVALKLISNSNLLTAFIPVAYSHCAVYLNCCYVASAKQYVLTGSLALPKRVVDCIYSSRKTVEFY